MPPLRSRRDSVAGLRWFAREGGAANAGPVLVMIHGLVVSGDYLLPSARRLARWHRVLVPDLPGFGRSQAPEDVPDVAGLAALLQAWLEAVAPGPVMLVGNSMGCQVIAELALRLHPGSGSPVRMEAAILCSPSVDASARRPLPQLLRWLSAWPHEAFWIGPLIARDAWRAGPLRGWRTFRHALSHRLEERLDGLRCPVLVVRGARDPLVSEGWAAELARRLPHGQLRVLAGAAHAPNYSQPRGFSTLVHRFFRRVVAGPGGRTAAAVATPSAAIRHNAP